MTQSDKNIIDIIQEMYNDMPPVNHIHDWVIVIRCGKCCTPQYVSARDPFCSNCDNDALRDYLTTKP